MNLPDSVSLLFMGVSLAGLIWNALNAWEAWRVRQWPVLVRIVFRRRARPSNVLPFTRRAS